MNGWDLRNQVRQRLAGESGTLHKEAELRVALCYPSPYTLGMSSLGFQTIYREINAHEGACAERAFLPDSPEDYRASRTPVFSYESERPLGEFAVLAFSISYELEISGLFEVLDLSGIPLLRTQRSEQHPLIVAGGPLTNSNPRPLDPFVDLIVVGEAEELIHELLDAAARMRRGDLLEHFACAPGCYVPGRSHAVPPAAKASDSRLPAYSQILTGKSVLSSMFLIEPERGCSRGCTYCVMRRAAHGGMRLVPPEEVMRRIPEQARRVGLVGAAVTDHPRIKDIVRRIVESKREIGISSLRADRLDGELVGLLARGGYRTLTTASDGASQRLRNLVDRQTTEQHLIRVADLARRYRLHRLKLYELIGLPTETSEDIEEMVRLSRELARIVPLSLSVSPFVAKRNTPLDGSPFEAVPSLEEKLARLRSAMKGKVQLRSASPRWARVEHMLAQSGEAAGLAAMDAWRSGGGYAAWNRAFLGREVQPFPGVVVLNGRRPAPRVPSRDTDRCAEKTGPAEESPIR